MVIPAIRWMMVSMVTRIVFQSFIHSFIHSFIQKIFTEYLLWYCGRPGILKVNIDRAALKEYAVW